MGFDAYPITLKNPNCACTEEGVGNRLWCVSNNQSHYGGPDIRDSKTLVRIIYGGNDMKTFMANPATIDRKWYVVDATNKTLGRLASEVAKVLRGKNKAIFTPSMDMGDYVIIINAKNVKVTGKKLDQKVYYHHSGWVGGLKSKTLREMMATKPETVVEMAVKGMLPKGPLGSQMYKKLFVYAGAEHPHAAQKPEELTF